jgi:hypothetical protein
MQAQVEIVTDEVTTLAANIFSRNRAFSDRNEGRWFNSRLTTALYSHLRNQEAWMTSLIGSMIGGSPQAVRVPVKDQGVESAAQLAMDKARQAAKSAFETQTRGAPVDSSKLPIELPDVSQIAPEKRSDVMNMAKMLSMNSINAGRQFVSSNNGQPITSLSDYIQSLQGAIDKGFSGVA